jgi:hypothetical protein
MAVGKLDPNMMDTADRKDVGQVLGEPSGVAAQL